MARRLVDQYQKRESSPQPSDKHAAEDYEFTISMSEIGAEGMKNPLQPGGSTYKTTWKQTARKEVPVIVKVLTRINYKEAQRLYYVGHKNIVRFYGAIIEPPMFGIVLELCNKPSLFDYLRKNPKPDLELALDLASGIASGLAYLHEGATDAGPIKHTQLTSAKVMLHEKNGKLIPKIGGFGYSRRNRGTQMTGSFGRMQCFQWMPPELIAGRRSHLASDVYSFGIILWELLTGEIPYEGKMMFQAMQDITSGKHLAIPDDCPSDLKDLMKQCWAEKPANRPSLKRVISRLDFQPLLEQRSIEETDNATDPIDSETEKDPWEDLGYDKIEFGELIGKGRMGSTHRATYNRRPIAVKTFYRGLVTRDNFESYMRDVCCVDHQNIVKIIGGFSDQLVIVLESMKTSLRKKLQTGPITDKRLLKHVARGVASGLDHLHCTPPCHMVHGNLTSTNILLDEHDNAKITDIYYVYMRFDKVMTSDEDSIYVDPNFNQLSTEGDIYSFGIILIEMRAGEIPSRTNARAYGIVNDTWPALYTLARTCVSKTRRPEKMKAIIEELDKLE